MGLCTVFLRGFFFSLAIACSCLQGIGLHIANQTPHTLRMRMSTEHREYIADLIPRQSYFFSHFPYNMTIYHPQGTCSQFYNIGMNPSVFDTLLIRTQNNNPGCAVLGFTGKTRQMTPRTVGPVPFDPNYCRRNCWNPTTGTMGPHKTTGVLTGPMASRSATILGSGTDNVEPNPAVT